MNSRWLRSAHPPRRVAWRSLAGALVTALLLAACSSSPSDEQPGNASDTASSAGEEPSWLTEARADFDKLTAVPTTIWAEQLGAFEAKPGGRLFLVDCPVSEGCTNFHTSVKEAAKVIGYDLEICGGKTPEQVSQCFANAIIAKPDAIVTGGASQLANGPDFDKVKAAGIPLVTSHDGDRPKSDAVAVQIAGGDYIYEHGVNQAKGIIAKSGGKANVIYFRSKEYASEIETERGFRDQMAKCTTCEVKVVDYAISTMATALTPQALAVIQQNSDVNWYAAPNDGAAGAIVDAIRQSGKRDLHVAGLYGFSPNIQLIKDGSQDFTIMQGRREEGWTAVDAAARIYSGVPVKPVAALSRMAITPDNVADVLPFYQGPDGYQEQFKKLWGR